MLYQWARKFKQKWQQLTLTVTLKDAAIKKMRLSVTGYSQGEYYYALSQRGSIIRYKNYGITKDKNVAA